jgi:hypothetical protein
MSAPTTLKEGYAVGVALREPIGTQRFYVGEVQAVDNLGVRLTCIDWLLGAFSGFDLWFPWSNVLGMTEVCIPQMHDMGKVWQHCVSGSQQRHNQPEREEASDDE